MEIVSKPLIFYGPMRGGSSIFQLKVALTSIRKGKYIAR